VALARVVEAEAEGKTYLAYEMSPKKTFQFFIRAFVTSSKRLLHAVCLHQIYINLDMLNKKVIHAYNDSNRNQRYVHTLSDKEGVWKTASLLTKGHY
jgi:hypothetical protein